MVRSLQVSITTSQTSHLQPSCTRLCFRSLDLERNRLKNYSRFFVCFLLKIWQRVVQFFSFLSFLLKIFQIQIEFCVKIIRLVVCLVSFFNGLMHYYIFLVLVKYKYNLHNFLLILQIENRLSKLYSFKIRKKQAVIAEHNLFILNLNAFLLHCEQDRSLLEDPC